MSTGGARTCCPMSGKLLRWNHLDPTRDSLNFACGKLNGDLAGILGFVPTSHFDSELPYASDLWLVMWKARKDTKLPGLGVALLNTSAKSLLRRTSIPLETMSRLRRLSIACSASSLIDLDHFYRANPLKE